MSAGIGGGDAPALERLVREAALAGILPPGAGLPPQDSRPWPLVLLSALGAWLATLPLLVAVAMLLGKIMTGGAGPYVVGVALTAGTVAALRFRQLSLFLEQLALSLLMVGMVLLAYGLLRDLPPQAAPALLALLVCGVAWAVPRDWLRVLLGGAAALLMMLAMLTDDRHFFGRYLPFNGWLALHAALALWAGVYFLQRQVLRGGATARFAALLEALSGGWLLTLLAGLALWSGVTFMLAGSFGDGVLGSLASESGPGALPARQDQLMRLLSAGVALAGAAWLARVWPALRQGWIGAAALVLVGLAWLMPALGAVWLALALCVAGARWRLAIAAALAAAWIIGGFYYQLHWPLVDKALLLMGAAALLGALAWLGPRLARPRSAPASEAPATPGAPGVQTGSAPAPALPDTRARRAGLLLGALAVLAVANIGIWQKESLIAHGQPVWIALAPVDPRSLMQGDYMRLNFLAFEQVRDLPHGMVGAQRPRLVGRRDARGVATFGRVYGGEALAPGEFLMELTPNKGRWMLVSDAWYFKEGEAARWSAAKYGEFRVAADGRALLVGLRGENLEAL